MEEKPNYYGIMTADVRYCKNLKPMEKIMMVEFTCLTNKNGYSNAGNEYFAELYEVDNCTVSRWIKNLEKNGFIKIEYVYDGCRIKERKIYLTNDLKVNHIQNNQSPVDLKVNHTIDLKVKDNNTSINNTRVNINTRNKVYTEQASRLTVYLYDECKKDNPHFSKTETELSKWTDAFEKLNRIDGYPYEEIERVLKWAKNDSFWRQNILSGVRFRDKFEQLYTKSKNKQGYQQQRSSAYDVACNHIKKDVDYSKDMNILPNGEIGF